MSQRVLVVDDDEALRALLGRSLSLEGFQVLTVPDGERAVRVVAEQPVDLVVLDVVMGPERMDGFDVCRELRAVDEELPIVFLTGRDAVADRVAGLGLGADDYVLKPFAFPELLARIRVRLRHRTQRGGGELRFTDLRIDPGSREAWRGERRIGLTATEFELLHLFVRNPRVVLTRDVIFERVWGYELLGESKVIEVYVSYLRQKLETADEPRLIHTVRGVGYVLREHA